ncbi:SDR family oxidoreductase [Paenibacillus physcomitrellae]|uniref:Oxidoreductase n=1 Tax=Paenibacillus physcomitrellae TaxID=1619311 RepID=A0ABQ1FUP9_9BACL|nr:SDR family oxidoreductase [Paenibacillus physcomitrellae]GGA29724.1 oxidoreductase [Paenibacillus physcomitrellae]
MFDYHLDEQLRNKTIAITGASKGIGRETARILSQMGANLVLGARTQSEPGPLADGCQSGPLWVELDVTSEESIAEFTNKAVSRFGKIDALINCAGVGVFEPILSLSTEDFDRMLSVNLRGTFLMNKYVGRHMVQNGQGKIINLISIAGTTALPGCGGYSASKFGLLGLSRVMQAELRGQGLEVISVLPGAAATSFWDQMENTPNPEQMIPSESLARHLIYLLGQQKGAFVDEITIMPTLGIL